MTDDRRFSHSLLDTFMECGRKAYYRYVERLPDPPSPALIKGRACDEGWNDALQRKIDGGTMVLDELKTLTEEKYRDAVREVGIHEINWQDPGDHKELARKHLNQALLHTENWFDHHYHLIEPEAIQIELHAQLPSGRDFVGYLDWRGTYNQRLVGIGDNKTGSSKMATGEADKAMQPSAYAFLLGKPIDFIFARSILTRAGGINSEAVVTHRTEGDIEWYGEAIADVEASWNAGNFIPNPKSNLCGPKFCSFWARCMPSKTVHAGAEPDAE